MDTIKYALATLIAVAGLTLAAPADGAPPAPTCMGRTVTIMGTPGDDNLVGQGGVTDVIYGAGGNDYISGGAWYGDDAIPGDKPDYLCGGPGNDSVNGSPGDDHLNGGDGRDHVEGDNGDDVMRGNTGADTIRDESCEDCLVNDDILIGGPGPDKLSNGWGYDRVKGNGGNDSLFDYECTPTILEGGRGDDTFESWSSSYEGYGGYVCSDRDFFGDKTSDTVRGGKGFDIGKHDRADWIARVEHVQFIRHGSWD